MGVTIMSDMIKIKENKSWGADSGPRFMLTFNTKASEEQKRKSSYDILSKLIKDNDIIMEVNGSLLNLPPKKRDSFASKFIEDIKALGLEYRCSNITSAVSNSLLNLFKNKTTEDQVVLAYVPNEIWSRAEMKNLIPFYGARYFVLKEKSDRSKALDYLQNIGENEQFDYFELIAFDAICLGAMGIYTKNYELSDFKAVLGIS